MLVVPPGHPWTSRRTIALDALCDETLIVREPGSGSRTALEQGLARAGRSLADLDVALELGSNAAIRDAVKRGLGVAFLSRFCIRRERDAKELGALSVRGLRLTRQFYLVHPRRRPLLPATTAFRHFVESHPIGKRAAPGP